MDFAEGFIYGSFFGFFFCVGCMFVQMQLAKSRMKSKTVGEVTKK